MHVASRGRAVSTRDDAASNSYGLAKKIRSPQEADFNIETKRKLFPEYRLIHPQRLPNLQNHIF